MICYIIFLKLSSPDVVSIRSLSHEHAVIADEVWPYRHQGSLFLLKRLIDWNLSVGAFKDGQLVAWCFRYIINDIFIKCLLTVKAFHLDHKVVRWELCK